MVASHLKRVLITGASGTLGFNIVRHFGRHRPETKLCVLVRTPDPKLFEEFPSVVVKQADLQDFASIHEIVQEFEPDAIIHCAASGVRPSKIGYFEFVTLNATATLQLFEASCKLERCHFIQISTGLVYGSQERPCREGDPVNTLHPYGATKAAADCLLRAGAERLNRHLTIIRPFSFTGNHDGGDRLFPSLLRAAQDGTSFSMSPGTQLRDFCAVQDVVDFVTLVLDEGEQPSRDIFNVGSGLSISLGRIVHSVIRQLKIEVDLRMGDRPFHPLEPMQLIADISRAESLGWRPRINLAYAVWELARSQFPNLVVEEPEKYR